MRILCLWMLAIAVVLAGAETSIASHLYGGNGGYGKNNKSQNTAPPASQPSGPPSQLSIDQAAQKAAADDLAKYQQAMQAVSDAAWQQYQQNDPDWSDLQSKLTGAQSSLDTARQASKDALTSNPDYQSAVAAQKKATADLDAAKTSGDADPNDLAPLAEAKMQATLSVRKFEKQVQESDTGVQSAVEQLAIAQHGVDMAKMKFQQTLSQDKNYTAAKVTVQAAQTRYDAIHAKVLADAPESGGD